MIDFCNTDEESISVSDNIVPRDGWGATEYDEFQVPFQWIGKQATLDLQSHTKAGSLYLFAGSPDFDGARYVTAKMPERSVSLEIKPGWHGYQFQLGSPTTSGAYQVSILIDRLLDIDSDSRELGLMIQSLLYVEHRINDIDTEIMKRDRYIQRRVRYYSSPDAPAILWLASFPRSGNTWMRFLLTNLLFEPVIASSTIGRYIDELIDPFSEFHSDEHKTVDVFGTNRAHIIKTHMSYRRGMPLRERTIGAIYVMRNPLDVAVSIGRYSTAETEKTISDFLSYGTTRGMQSSDGVCLLNHVFSWMELARIAHSIPVFLVKYEELQKDPFSVCDRLLKWLNIEISEDKIRAAINRSSFENLQKIESYEVQNKNPGIFFDVERKAHIETGWRFLGAGESGNYLESLSHEQIRRGLSTFGPLMKQFGYIQD